MSFFLGYGIASVLGKPPQCLLCRESDAALGAGGLLEIASILYHEHPAGV